MFEETCIYRLINICKDCKKDYDPNHYPNNLDCKYYKKIKIVIFEVKERVNNMIIIGLENCPGCKLFKSRHEDLPYIEVLRNHSEDPKNIAVKAALAKLHIGKFPVILNPGMTKVIPLSTVDPEFAKTMEE